MWFIMQAKHYLPILSLGFSLAACQSFNLPWNQDNDPQAESFVRAGDYVHAMQRYSQLAQTRSNPDHYWLLAADAGLRAGDDGAARNMARSIRPRELTKEELTRYNLLTSRLDLNAGEFRDALAKLDTLAPDRLSRDDQINYYTLRASALNQSGDLIGSANARTQLAPLLQTPSDSSRNNQAILENLAQISQSTLDAQSSHAQETLKGWMELSLALRQDEGSSNPKALTNWKAQHPQHPANSAWLDGLSSKPSSPLKPKPTNRQSADLPSSPYIAVLLPEKGPYAQVAKAIAEGVRSAYAEDHSPTKPLLQFEDTSSGDIVQHYRKVTQGPATAVIGPLSKEEVAAIGKLKELSAPVLALNQIGGTTPSQMLQMGLTPEQDVEALAAQAFADGKRVALMLVTDTSYGQRLGLHFEEVWKKMGGKTTLIRRFTQHGGNTGTVVKELTGVPFSQDTFIFLVADAQDARSILPQIRPTGSDLPRFPVYSTGHAYNIREAAANQQLEGMVLCDIPWFMHQDDSGPLSFKNQASHTAEIPPEALRLFALGVDAYHLAASGKMGQPAPNTFEGASGSWKWGGEEATQRQLACGPIEAGQPHPRTP
jgi:outer membrane PBP1 activator LpoA protein